MLSTILKIGSIIGAFGSIFSVMIACYKAIKKIDTKFEDGDVITKKYRIISKEAIK